MKKSVEKTTRTTLNCNEWWFSFTEKASVYSLWHIRRSKRQDMTVTKESIYDLQKLVQEIIKELESGKE